MSLVSFSAELLGALATISPISQRFVIVTSKRQALGWIFRQISWKFCILCGQKCAEMADLDDFFAKKDKKKSKVKKFTTADDLVKKLEDTSKKSDSKGKTRGAGNEEEYHNQEHVSLSVFHPLGKIANSLGCFLLGKEDEWKDFEEERKDYSGLKIGQLTLNEEDHHTDGDQGSEAQSDTEGNAEAGERKTGPWKAVPEAAPQQPPQPPAQQSQPAEPKIYRPPALQSQVRPTSFPFVWLFFRKTMFSIEKSC